MFERHVKDDPEALKDLKALYNNVRVMWAAVQGRTDLNSQQKAEIISILGGFAARAAPYVGDAP